MADEVKKESTDSLHDIFSSSEAKEPSAESKPTPSETPPVETTDTPKEESSPSVDAETPPDEKKDESEVSETPSDKEENAPALAAKAAAEKKAAEETKAKEESASDLPFKQRFEDTQKWAQGINQENVQLRQIAEAQKQKLLQLQKKVDGTWTDEDEAASQVGHTPQDMANHARLQGKAEASYAAAVRELGDAAVNARLGEFHSMFNNNQAIQRAISDSQSPVHEALAIMDRYHFEKEHGATPKQWTDSITKKVTADLEKSLRKTILDEIKAGRQKAADTPETLASTSGGAGDGSKLKEEAAPSLKSIFN